MNVRQFRWLILIVVHDFSEEENQENLEKVIDEEILKVGTSDQDKLLLVRQSYNRRTKYKFKTSISELQKLASGKFKLKKISNAEFDFHDERSWIKLMKWVSKYYQASYICLNTISHGAGFGMTGVTDDDSEVKFGKVAIVPDSFLTGEFIINGGFVVERPRSKGVSVITLPEKSASCKSLQMLWISELSNALKAAYGKRKIDVLLFNNCFMQVYENVWMLADNIKYVAAAETQFFSYGFNYAGLLENLTLNTTYSPTQLVETIIPDLEVKWTNAGIKRLEDICVSVLDLDQIEKISPVFEKIVTFLSNLPDKELRKVMTTRFQKIRTVTATPAGAGSGKVITADLSHFFQLMAKKFSSNKTFVNTVKKFNELFQKNCRIDIREGKNLIKFDKKHTDKYKVQGVAIFLPEAIENETLSEIMSCAYFGSISPDQRADIKIPLIRFKKQSQWDNLVERMLGLQ